MNFLRRQIFLTGTLRVQLLSCHRFSTTPIQEELVCRVAKSSDFDDVLKLSEVLYDGYDYLPVVYHEWLKRENVAIMLMFAGRDLVGLQASHIVDDGKTFVRRAGRIASNLRGQGFRRTLAAAMDEYMRANFLKVSRERLVTSAELKVKGLNPYYKILERDKLFFLVEAKSTGRSDRHPSCPAHSLSSMKESQIKSCTNEYFSNVILSSSLIEKLFPSNVFMFNSCPFEPLRSNVHLILQECDGLHFFVENCFGETCPRSFSCGVHAKRVNCEIWEATVYTDDPAVFEAHLLYQFKRASEIIDGNFLFLSVQNKAMTPCVRMVLGEMLQLKETNVYDEGETARTLYEREVTR